ncbi:hypothetical protein [Mycobacterium avium]|uniref:hypothetical protein n=1 Tax=Mycobacterium avium TaxID=1764 RepID=UPI000BB09B55|nr:hypothetical protein [Mycobacterium avium]PBA68977.1 hypothetical protein CKJ76_25155 [Mycobacterium avium]
MAQANGRKMHPWAQWDQINSPHESFFIPHPPDFIWPADHTWCVAATHVTSTLIGGSLQLVDELCAAETVEALPIPPEAPFDLDPFDDPFNCS